MALNKKKPGAFHNLMTCRIQGPRWLNSELCTVLSFCYVRKNPSITFFHWFKWLFFKENRIATSKCKSSPRKESNGKFNRHMHIAHTHKCSHWRLNIIVSIVELCQSRDFSCRCSSSQSLYYLIFKNRRNKFLLIFFLHHFRHRHRSKLYMCTSACCTLHTSICTYNG